MSEDFGRLATGQLCPMKSFTVVRGDKTVGEVNLSYRKPKGKRWVFLLLGAENDDGTEPLDAMEVMDKMGWMPKPEGQ